MVYDKIDMRREREEGFGEGFMFGATLVSVFAIIILLWILGQ